jgi:hypothetical protein
MASPAGKSSHKVNEVLIDFAPHVGSGHLALIKPWPGADSAYEQAVGSLNRILRFVTSKPTIKGATYVVREGHPEKVVPVPDAVLSPTDLAEAQTLWKKYLDQAQATKDQVLGLTKAIEDEKSRIQSLEDLMVAANLNAEGKTQAQTSRDVLVVETAKLKKLQTQFDQNRTKLEEAVKAHTFLLEAINKKAVYRVLPSQSTVKIHVESSGPLSTFDLEIFTNWLSFFDDAHLQDARGQIRWAPAKAWDAANWKPIPLEPEFAKKKSIDLTAAQKNHRQLILNFNSAFPKDRIKVAQGAGPRFIPGKASQAAQILPKKQGRAPPPPPEGGWKKAPASIRFVKPAAAITDDSSSGSEQLEKQSREGEVGSSGSYRGESSEKRQKGESRQATQARPASPKKERQAKLPSKSVEEIPEKGRPQRTAITATRKALAETIEVDIPNPDFKMSVLENYVDQLWAARTVENPERNLNAVKYSIVHDLIKELSQDIPVPDWKTPLKGITIPAFRIKAHLTAAQLVTYVKSREKLPIPDVEMAKDIRFGSCWKWGTSSEQIATELFSTTKYVQLAAARDDLSGPEFSGPEEEPSSSKKKSRKQKGKQTALPQENPLDVNTKGVPRFKRHGLTHEDMAKIRLASGLPPYIPPTVGTDGTVLTVHQAPTPRWLVEGFALKRDQFLTDVKAGKVTGKSFSVYKRDQAPDPRKDLKAQYAALLGEWSQVRKTYKSVPLVSNPQTELEKALTREYQSVHDRLTRRFPTFKNFLPKIGKKTLKKGKPSANPRQQDTRPFYWKKGKKVFINTPTPPTPVVQPVPVTAAPIPPPSDAGGLGSLVAALTPLITLIGALVNAVRPITP